MKKTYALLVSLAMGLAATAQTPAEPNRLFINDPSGNRSGYVIDRVADITFGKVEGEVLAEIDIHAVTKSELTVSVTRTQDCESFIIDVIPQTVANMLTTPEMTINYLETTQKQKPTEYHQDFDHASMTGMDLSYGGEYAIITIAIDGYGVKDGVCRADFTVPTAPLTGNPAVAARLVEATQHSFTIEFTPNSDVSTYYTVAGEKGGFEQQYAQFGPMWGFASITEMIMEWGLENTGTQTKTWDDMDPNGEYEVYIVCCDKKGVPAPPTVFETATLSMGGHGEASVDMELGAYKLEQWGDEKLPSQFITFTPNEESAAYRYGVYLAEIYDEKTAEIKAELCSDPEVPMAYWFFYEPLTTDFQINPGVASVAIAAAKNLDGKWGPIKELRFTTPSERPTQAPAPGTLKSRPVSGEKTRLAGQGRLPQLPRTGKIQLR